MTAQPDTRSYRILVEDRLYLVNFLPGARAIAFYQVIDSDKSILLALFKEKKKKA